MNRRATGEKTAAQIRMMRAAGLVVSEALQEMGAAVVPGVTTSQLEVIAAEVLARRGANSCFLGYGAQWGAVPFPARICASVNDQVVHAIPNDTPLSPGDIVSIDFGAEIDGWHGDAARTFIVGETDQRSRVMIETCREAMWAGIAAIAVGRRVGDIGHAVSESVASAEFAFSIVREFTGHGIGRAMHESPDVPNIGRPRRGAKLTAGMCLAIEPILTLGEPDVATLDDDWTVVTDDGSRAAHWENTVALLPDGLWVLTEPDGGREELEARGVRVASIAQ